METERRVRPLRGRGICWGPLPQVPFGRPGLFEVRPVRGRDPCSDEPPLPDLRRPIRGLPPPGARSGITRTFSSHGANRALFSLRALSGNKQTLFVTRCESGGVLHELVVPRRALFWVTKAMRVRPLRGRGICWGPLPRVPFGHPGLFEVRPVRGRDPCSDEPPLPDLRRPIRGLPPPGARSGITRTFSSHGANRALFSLRALSGNKQTLFVTRCESGGVLHELVVPRRALFWVTKGDSHSPPSGTGHWLGFDTPGSLRSPGAIRGLPPPGAWSGNARSFSSPGAIRGGSPSAWSSTTLACWSTWAIHG